MYKILPFEKGIVSCYPSYGTYFSIINAYNKNYLAWIYNYFVQLLVPCDFSKGMRMDFAPPHMQAFPWVVTNVMDRTLVEIKWSSFIEFVRDCINRSFYVYALLDVSFIPAYNQKEHKQHEVALIGYDDKKEQVVFADNYDKGRYNIGTATYTEINNADAGMKNNNLADWLTGYNLLKVRKVFDFGMYKIGNEYNHEFNINTYVNLLEDYLYARESYSRWAQAPIFVFPHKLEEEYRWGIKVYEILKKYLILYTGNNVLFDRRSFAVLKSHKELLKNTFFYLVKNKYVKNDELIYQKIDDNLNISSYILRLVIKLSIIYDVKAKKSIIEYLEILEKNDIIIITYLLENLGSI